MESSIRRITGTMPICVSLSTLRRSSIYLIMATNNLEYPFQTNILSITVLHSGLEGSSPARLELFITRSRMGTSGSCAFIFPASSRGVSKSRPAIRITMSYLLPENISFADSGVYAQVTRGTVFKFKLKNSP